MGILDQYVTDEDKEELSKNLKLPATEKNTSVNTKKNQTKSNISESEKKKTAKKIQQSETGHSEIDEDLQSVISDFVATYKQSDKTGRMIRIQDAHYRKLVSLRADGISVSEFISFSVHYFLNSKDIDLIIKQLKP